MPFDDYFDAAELAEYDDGSDGYDAVKVSGVTVTAEKEKAIACVIDNEEFWIPKSQLLDDSVENLGDTGTLIITAWIAEQKGIKGKVTRSVSGNGAYGYFPCRNETPSQPEEMPMSYENAPSTQMLATRCAICGRQLRDAKSIERGIGPECFEKYGGAEANIDPDWISASRALNEPLNVSAGHLSAANMLIHRISVNQGSDVAMRCAAALWHLGYRKVVMAIGKNRPNAIRAIKVHEEIIRLSGRTCVVLLAPDNGKFKERLRALSILPCDARPRFIFKQDLKRGVWEAIKACYPKGTLVLGKKAVLL